MKIPTTYKLKLYRDEDGAWIAEVPSVAGVRSDGRSLEEARRNVREALGLADDQEITEAMAAAAVFVDDIDLPIGGQNAIAVARAARELANEAEARAVAAQEAAVRLLHIEGGLSVRDVGELLGVSGAMVHKRASYIRENAPGLLLVEERGPTYRTGSEAPRRATSTTKKKASPAAKKKTRRA